VENAHHEAWEILVEYRDVLDDMVLKLLDKETLNKEEVMEIFAPVQKRPPRDHPTGNGRRPLSTRPPVLTPAELAVMGPADLAELEDLARGRKPAGSPAKATSRRRAPAADAPSRSRATVNRAANAARKATGAARSAQAPEQAPAAPVVPPPVEPGAPAARPRTVQPPPPGVRAGRPAPTRRPDPRSRTVTVPAREVLGLPPLGRTRVMGVLNVTPGLVQRRRPVRRPAAAVDQGLRLLADGADLLDVGGESTRPGAERVTEDEERARVLPVVAALAAAGAVVSVDTMRAAVAQAAVDAGAQVVNDVSGGLADPRMLDVVAAAGVVYTAMHWRGHSRDMQSRAVYDDVVAEVCAELQRRAEAAERPGWTPASWCWTRGSASPRPPSTAGSWCARCRRCVSWAARCWSGASRKGFLGALLADASGLAAAGPRAGRRDGGGHRAGRAGRRVGGPGPRGARQRGRGAGRGPVGSPADDDAEVGS
jgi:dihydropteroate synthase